MSFILHPKIENCLYRSKTNSTNQDAAQLLSKNQQSKNSILYTFHQKEGKGQIGRTWFNGENNNIACSIVLHFQGLFVLWSSYINFWFANQIRAYVAKLLPNHKVKIKWPNDIYVDGYKIAGLLVQSAILGKQVKNAVLGVGININQETFPSALPNPTSVVLLNDTPLDLEETTQKLKQHLEEAFETFSYDNLSDIRTEYHNHLYLKNSLHRFTVNSSGNVLEGKIINVNDQGLLIIDSGGKRLKFKFREISY